MWQSLNVRTRILLGYGLILGLTAALAFFLAFRIETLNAQIARLNTSVAIEADIGAQLAARVSSTQQSIDRYLQQPRPDNLQSARESLQGLHEAVARAHTGLTGSAQLQRIDALARQAVAYEAAFQNLSTLMQEQASIRRSLSTQLFASSTSVNTTIANAVVAGDAGPAVLEELTQAQRSLLLANLWTGALTPEDVDDQEESILRELDRARDILEANAAGPDNATGIITEKTLNDVQRASDSTTTLMQNLQEARQVRSVLLDELGEALKVQADAIAQEALTSLIRSTTDLEEQTRQTQQVVALAMLFTLMFALLATLVLARTITHPLGELVTATRRLHEGDYDVAVPERDRSEIGQLARAFNQMTQTLKQQHEEVLQQQEDLRRRNQDLEQALAEIKTATAAREALAATVRRLSVPVISILDRVIVVPLVGEIDEERAHLLIDRLLKGITEQNARIAILDITGVPFVDSATADWLVRTASATRLLGTQCVLVGISPEVAQALVANGAELAGLITRADLRSAVEYAMRAGRA